MNRREVIHALLAVAAATEPLRTFAQSRRGKVMRVGALFLVSAANVTLPPLLPAALRKLGWIEGQNLLFDRRFGDGRLTELPRLASELVQLNPDVIVVQTNLEAQAVLRATNTIPIVVAVAFDPVGSGFAQTLAHPGGSVTGFVYPEPAFVAKMVQFLFEAVPTVRRLGLVYDPRIPGTETYIDADQRAAEAAHVEVRRLPVRGAEDIATALAMIEKEHVDALKIAPGGAVAIGISAILAFAAERRLPTAWGLPDPVERGGLLSYAPNIAELFGRVADFVDRILKGAKPADLPFEHPTRFELTLNLKTAKALGIKIPQSVLLRADRLIE